MSGEPSRAERKGQRRSITFEFGLVQVPVGATMPLTAALIASFDVGNARSTDGLADRLGRDVPPPVLAVLPVWFVAAAGATFAVGRSICRRADGPSDAPGRIASGRPPERSPMMARGGDTGDRLDATRSTPGSGLDVTPVKAIVGPRDVSGPLGDNGPGLQARAKFVHRTTFPTP